MSWLDRLLDRISREQRTELRFEEAHPVELRLPRDPARFLRALTLLAGADAIVCFEGTTEKYAQGWLRQHQISPLVRIRGGTIFPPSDFYHVPLRPDLMADLAQLVDSRRIALPTIHVQVYERQRVILAWWDAFLDDPVSISRSIAPDRVAAFSAAAGGEPIAQDESGNTRSG